MRQKTVILHLFILMYFMLSLIGCGSTGESILQSDMQVDQLSGSEKQAESSEANKQEADAEGLLPGQESVATSQEEPAIDAEQGAVIVIPESTEKSSDLTFEPIPEKQDEVAVEPKTAEIKDAPVSKGPNHFVITTQPKDASHPLFGKGHEFGFSVNNVPGKDVVLERGSAYQFEVASDPKHDVYISIKQIGWGGSPWVDGVEGMYTYKGTISFVPPENTPEKLYYACRNHPYMGGTMHIVNPGQKIVLKQHSAQAVDKTADSVEQVSAATVKQKLMYVDMLVKSKARQGNDGNGNGEVLALQNKAKKYIADAQNKLNAGANAEALALTEKAITSIKRSAKLVPNKSEMERMKARYTELLTSVLDFEASHKDNYDRIVKKQGKDKAVAYDKNEVKRLKARAAISAEKGGYSTANKDLEKAQHIITLAVHAMLNDQTIVYDLNFESSEEEYEYEAKRFTGYEELIPVAIEAKKPAAGAIKLMESFLEKGRGMRDSAVQKATQGDYPTAIAMMQDATKSVRRALRMVGVMQ